MSDIPLISVIFSFRNEEEVIPELLKNVREVFSQLKADYELIFVNDDSTDRSKEILMGEIDKDKRIKLINMSRRFGGEVCTFAGMRHAKGDAVIYMDCDLQDPPDVIPKLIEKWLEGYDVVYTTRTMREGESLIRSWITKLGYKIIRLMSEVDIPVDSGDFKLISRRALLELMKIDEHDPYVKGLVSWIGFKQTPVFYVRKKRFSGKTHYSFLWGNPLKSLVSGITSFSLAPLYVSLLLGFLVVLSAFFYLAHILFMKFIGMSMPGWTALMAGILILGGMQLFTTGILGIYLGRIYNEVKDRPKYIIESKLGFDK